MGFLGNHPFKTRLRWAKSSPMPHSAEAPKTPTTAETIAFSMNKAAMMHVNLDDDGMPNTDGQEGTNSNNDSCEIHNSQLSIINYLVVWNPSKF